MLGYMQYTQDYDEKVVPVYYYTTGWYNTMQPYIKSTQILKCPSDSSEKPASFTDQITPNGYRVSYAYNFDVGGFVFQPVSIAAFSFPASAVAITDAGSVADSAYPYTVTEQSPLKDLDNSRRILAIGDLTQPRQATTEQDFMAPTPRHLGTVVCAFVDGHVKALRPEKFYYSGSRFMYPIRDSE